VDTPNDDQKEPRIPRIEDLVALCRRLNELGAKYIVVGGMAIIQSGYGRTTGDIDLLIDTALENEAKVFAALMSLPDQAVRELQPGEVEQYTVVRVADEIIVDLMRSACGIGYHEAAPFVHLVEVDGVSIPIASPELLWRMKQTGREKDKLDLIYLRELLKKD
jgi:hypothetical protein